jgi:hypothetical protein
MGTFIIRREAGFRIQDSGFRSQDSGFRIQDSGFRIQKSGSVPLRLLRLCVESPIPGALMSSVLEPGVSTQRYRTGLLNPES